MDRQRRHGGTQRWQGRPVRASLLRLAIYAVPIAASVAVAFVVSRLLTPAPDAVGLVLRWIAVLVPATLALWLVDRFARRFLPLATLLRLSLLFPDRAPSRYAVARQVRSTRELEQRVAAARAGRIGEEPAEAAQTILALVAALSEHDRRTRGHSERVRIYTDLLAEEIGLPAGERDRLRWAALVHDMGKLMVPEEILNKAGRPTEDEWKILRRHPEDGARLCGPLLPWLGEAGGAIVQHHERFDGTGYPAGLAGADITLAGRILAVTDAFEVMTAARPYKRSMSAQEARAELARCAGTQFDPFVVRRFLNISLGRLRLAMGPLSWLAQWPVLARIPQVGQSAGQAGVALGGAAAIGVAGVLPQPPAAVADPERPLVAEGAAGSHNGQDRDGQAPAPRSVRSVAVREATIPDRSGQIALADESDGTIATADPAPVEETQSERRTYDLVGGSVTLRLSPDRVELLSTSPGEGFEERIDLRDGTEVRVEFRSGTHRSRLRVRADGTDYEERIDEDPR